MRKSRDQVFFFTLIDLFLSALFLGFVLFAINRIKQSYIDDRTAALLMQIAQSENKTPLEVLSLTSDLRPLDSVANIRKLVDSVGGKKNIEKLLELKGSSTGAQLGDFLTNLVPLVKNKGGLEPFANSVVEKLGPVPCRYMIVGRRREVSVLATITVDDQEAIIVPENKTVWDSVLVSIGKSSELTQRVALGDFYNTFRKIKDTRQDCRFSVNLIEQTQYKRPRDIVRSVFTFAEIKE